MSIDIRQPEYAYLRAALERIGRDEFPGVADSTSFRWGGGYDFPAALGRGLARTILGTAEMSLNDFVSDVAGAPMPPAADGAPAPGWSGGWLGKLVDWIGGGAAATSASAEGGATDARSTIAAPPAVTGLSPYEQLLWDATMDEYSKRIYRHARAIEAADAALRQPGGTARAIAALAGA